MRSIDHPLYIAWRKMRARCNNPNDPNYLRYGGRGISVCPQWASFKKFLEDVGERPEGMTLDRIDNDGNYEPGNVRWATKSQQQSNQRKRAGATGSIPGVVQMPNGRWRARGPGRKHLGYFATEEEATQTYRDHRKAMKEGGYEVKLNG